MTLLSGENEHDPHRITAIGTEAVLFSSVFGGAISGMVHANLWAGIIKPVQREKASVCPGPVRRKPLHSGGVGYLLGVLQENFSWSTAGILTQAAAMGQKSAASYARA